MPPIRSSALRGAIIVTLCTAACGETAVEPTHTHALGRAAQPTATLSTRSFSGRAADSVSSVLEAAWARLGRRDEGNARHAWRKRNGVPDSVHDSLLAVPQVMPNVNRAVLESDAERPAPSILTHVEELHWGYWNYSVNLPGAVNAEMKFVGDAGEISLGSFIITGTKTYATYSIGGKIASGPGEIIGCTDTVFAGCSNQRHLGGLMTLQNAPFCDATASGNVSYSANNSTLSSGTPLLGTLFNPTNGMSSSLTSSISGSAPACDDVKTPPPVEQPTGSGPTETGGGTGATPPPEPWDPAPLPPPPSPDGPATFYCGTVKYYQIIDGEERFLAEVDVCYQA